MASTNFITYKGGLKTESITPIQSITHNLGESTAAWNDVHAKHFIAYNKTNSDILLGDGSTTTKQDLLQNYYTKKEADALHSSVVRIKGDTAVAYNESMDVWFLTMTPTQIGDAYISQHSGTYYNNSDGDLDSYTLEKGDVLIFIGNTDDSTTHPIPRYTVIQSNWTAQTGASDLQWGKSVTLATVGGVSVKAKLPESSAFATTATNLASAPSLATSGTTQITVTAGGKTSSAFTVPYATSAGSATNATYSTKIDVTNDSNATANHFLTFTSGSGNNQTLKLTGNIYCVPNKGQLIVTSNSNPYYKITQNGKNAFFQIYGDANDIYVGSTAVKSLKITQDGVVTAPSSISAAAFYETSDIRKKDIKSNLSLEKCYDLIDKCQTVIYSLKDQTKEQVGMIAQEIEEFFPEVINTDDEGFKSLAYDRLVVICFRVLKDVIKRLENLEQHG